MTPPRKVCLASLAPFVGGAEVAAERLALGLQAAGCDVFLVLGQRGDVLDRFERAGLRCLVAAMHFTDKWHPLRYFRSRFGMRRLLKRERPDVLHSNDLPTHQIMSGAAQGLAFPRICHHRYPFSGESIDWFDKFGAEHHLFVSQALMDEMCANSARLQASSRAVVYDGLLLPPLPTPEHRRAARQRLGLPADRLIVLFAGQIIERKGVAELIRAWSLLDAALTARASLIIVGDDLKGQGQYRRSMQELANQLNCPANFVGFQRNVDEWLLAADLAVVPSHVEPLGNATLEAMAYALPVIGSTVGGIPEMIVHEQTGLLVPPRSPEPLAAALKRLLSHEEERLRLGGQGRQRCTERFSLDSHVAAVRQEYDKVLAGRKPVGV